MKSVERAEYLQSMINECQTWVLERSKKHAEVTLLTGNAGSMCTMPFDNLDRICRDVISASKEVESQLLENMTSKQRMKEFSKYCTFCGVDDPNCRCCECCRDD